MGVLREPPVPVTVSGYFPGVELEHERVAVAGEEEIETVVGLTEQFTPEGADVARLTNPVNPLIGLTVTANVPTVAALKV